MTEKQLERMEELRGVLIDMIGEVMALETYLCCQTACESHFGRELSEEWLWRIGDYLKQHIRDTEVLAGWLLESAATL